MNMIKNISMGFCVAVCLAGCGKMDSVELAEKVKFEMQRDLVKQDVYSTLKVSEVTLVHKDGVVYEGIANGDVQGKPVSFNVKCEYDGKSWLWTAKPSDHNALSVMSHKGCQYAEKKFEENWPKVKKGAKDAYDAAAKKSGELCDKTKESYNAAVKKSGELYDKTKESCQEAAKKTGEWYDKTKDKAVASYNELKDKVKDRQKPAETNSCVTAK